jgi:hypothetical protein
VLVTHGSLDTGGLDEGRQLACVEVIVKQSVSMQDLVVVRHGSILNVGVGEDIGGLEGNVDIGRQLACVDVIVKQSVSPQETVLVRHGSKLGVGEMLGGLDEVGAQLACVDTKVTQPV